MIYMIGGAPRVGKSQLMQKLVIRKPMPSFSCDFLYDLEQVKKLEGFGNADILNKGRLFLPTLKELLINVSLRSKDCAIEGEVILPEFIPELMEKYDIKCCFLGLSEAKLDNIITHGSFFNWPRYKLNNNLGHEVATLAERTVSRSKTIQIEAEKYKLPYFDLVNNYGVESESALESLLS
jgi:hypothetical protein